MPFPGQHFHSSSTLSRTQIETSVVFAAHLQVEAEQGYAAPQSLEMASGLIASLYSRSPQQDVANQPAVSALPASPQTRLITHSMPPSSASQPANQPAHRRAMFEERTAVTLRRLWWYDLQWNALLPGL